MHTQTSPWLVCLLALTACSAGARDGQRDGSATAAGGNGTAQAGTGSNITQAGTGPSITIDVGGASAGGMAGSGGAGGTAVDCQSVCQGLGTCTAGVCTIRQNLGNIDAGT